MSSTREFLDYIKTHNLKYGTTAKFFKNLYTSKFKMHLLYANMSHIRHFESWVLIKIWSECFHSECQKMFQEYLECFTWRCTQGNRQAHYFSAWTSAIHKTCLCNNASLFSNWQGGLWMQTEMFTENWGAGWCQQAVNTHRQGVISMASTDGCEHWSVVRAGISHSKGKFYNCLIFADFFPNEQKYMEISNSYSVKVKSLRKRDVIRMDMWLGLGTTFGSKAS